MHFHIADAYNETGSRLHRMDARVKVALAFVLILLISLTPMGAFGGYIIFFALTMLGAIIARVEPLQVVRRSLVVLPFAGAAVSLIFTIPGEIIGTVPFVGWEMSIEGIVRFTSIIFKSMISVQVVVILMMATHFTDMLWAMGALKVPRILVSIISFMYRYMFVLADEALRLTRARDSRSAVLIVDDKSQAPPLMFRVRTTGQMVGNLFLRSYERSERVYLAMMARGYKGEIKQMSPPPINSADLFIAAIPLLIGILVIAAALLV